jgi:MinD-like ATPase involved in chromosome partitioning or flagellar assembly
MATSKGGVLKTTHTAGEGLVGDMALSPRGASVAVVEANPDNADLGIEFAVPREAPTVRELVAALEAGREAPRPHAVAGTRLEVWPEARQSAGQSHAQVAALHRFLRSRYTLVIADFNNCLPDRAGGAASELLDAWAPWVDVWVVPMDCSQKAVIAAAESIDALTATVRAASGGRTPGFVVPLVVNDRGARRDARHRALLGEFRTRGIAVVEVPHVPRVGRAALNRWRLTDVHRGLTAAWVAVLEEAVSAAEEVIV